jgi:hypothetical protein
MQTLHLHHMVNSHRGRSVNAEDVNNALAAAVVSTPCAIMKVHHVCRFAEKMMKVVVNAQKNKGGLSTVHGNKVKLDPTVLAIMEKRVADGIAAARAELMAQYGLSGDGNAGGGGGAGMSDAEKAELEELRKRVAGLSANAGGVRAPLDISGK